MTKAEVLAQKCRQILDDTEAVQKIKADYPKGGVESVLRGFTAMLLWVNGERKGHVIRQIGWLDPDFDGDADRNSKRQRVSNFTQLCDQIAWRALFLHRILTRAEDRGEVQTDEQRDLLLLAERVRLGCKAQAIPLFWPNGSRLRRDEAHELLRQGYEPSRMLTTNEPQNLDQHVRPKRLTQLKRDLTDYSWKQFQSLGNTMRKRRVGPKEAMFQFWTEIMIAMRRAAVDYRQPHFRSRAGEVRPNGGRPVDATFRALLPEITKALPPRLAGGSGQFPLEAALAQDNLGVVLVERISSGQPGRRFLIRAVQVLPDWQVVLPPSQGADMARVTPFAEVLEAMKNEADHRPVFVFVPWKPATEMMPKGLHNQFAWREANGRPAPTFLTPAAFLCSLTLLTRGFVEVRHVLDLIAGPTTPPKAGFHIVRLSDLLTACDAGAEDEYWRTPLLREAMLRHFEADTL